jgi:hypothetical protein
MFLLDVNCSEMFKFEADFGVLENMLMTFSRSPFHMMVRYGNLTSVEFLGIVMRGIFLAVGNDLKCAKS